MRLVITSEKPAIEIGSYQYLLNFTPNKREPQKLNGDTFEVTNLLEKQSSLKLKLNDEEIDFGPQVMKLLEQNKNKTGIVKVPDISMESDLGKYHIKLILNEIVREKFPYDNRINIYYENAYLLIKLK